ncbi:MAG: FtsW/RodA/SpoVE family cell cycle protein [Campylobacterales bacterium]
MVDKKLFIYVGIAITIGVIFSYSLSTFTVLLYGYNQFHFFIREAFVEVLSILLIWGISRADPDKTIVPLGFFFFFTGLFLMSIMPFLGEPLVKEIGGAKRWIKLPFISITPVEFFKIGMVFFLAWSFSRKIPEGKKNLLTELKIFLPYAGVFLLAVVLIALFQNDLGQVVLLATTFGILFFLAGTSFKFFATLSIVSFFMFVVFIITSEHRVLRIMQWWATSQETILSVMPTLLADKLRVDNLPEPYQVYHSLNAINHGGLSGVGLGNGLIKLGFLSEVHTDIVLAGIAEETGLLGLLGVTVLILLITHRIFKIANRSENKTYYLFCIGVALLISVSFLINALGISGIVPIKGIAVPFLSYGGSSLLAISIAIGMVLSISKKAKM